MRFPRSKLNLKMDGGMDGQDEFDERTVPSWPAEPGSSGFVPTLILQGYKCLLMQDIFFESIWTKLS